MRRLPLITVIVAFALFSCDRKVETINENNGLNTSDLKTFGTAGKELHPLEGGVEAELFSYTGKGCLTHMWFGGNWEKYGKLRIRVYIDLEESASIDMEMYLGHGIGFLDDTAPWGTEKIGKTGSPSGVYNNYHIPFGNHVRVTAQLPPEDKGNPEFWYIVRGTENLPLVISGVKLPENARLQLYTLENYLAEPLEEIDILNTPHSGLVYMTTIAAQGKTLTYLESIVRAYTKHSDEPMFLSSGLEDYFLGTYYFNKGLYHTDAAGLTHLDEEAGSFSAYRFHEEDPLIFQDGLRMTITCGESTEVKTWTPFPTTYSTYVWVYEW